MNPRRQILRDFFSETGLQGCHCGLATSIINERFQLARQREMRPGFSRTDSTIPKRFLPALLANMPMTQTLVLIASLSLGMLMPHLPGRYDATAATVSFSIQVGSYASLLLTPIGLAWLVDGWRSRLWNGIAWTACGLSALVAALVAVTDNAFCLGVLLGACAFNLVWRGYRRAHAALERAESRPVALPMLLATVPVGLVTFMLFVIPRAADWSRDRAIRHSGVLISEIESYRQRRGCYPPSLQSLNRDVPTGVVGLERFHYEPNGKSYNVYFVRPSVWLDAQEVVMFNPRGEHRFASHELDILQYDGDGLDLRRGDRRRTALNQPHWISILFD